MSVHRIKLVTILISLLLFILSLTQDALLIDFHEVHPMSSIECFLGGIIAFAGGGTFEQIIWLANPLSFFAIINLLLNRKRAVKSSCFAAILAISFSTWDEILGAESGSMAKIISLLPGYYLWVCSILVLLGGSYVYFRAMGNLESEVKITSQATQ